MKKLLLIAALLIPMVIFAQTEDESPSSSKQTTFEKFTSTYGQIVKFKDYELPDLTGKIGSGLSAVTYTVHVRVREVIVGDEKSLFLHLSRKPYERPERVAFIAYEDVVEINKALTELVKQSNNDSTGDANYLENKFRTKDDFYIGYYIDKTVSKKGEESNELRWYVCLDDRYNYSTAFFPNSEGLVSLFETAIQKMDEIK